MSTAGYSAEVESRRSAAQATEYERLAAEARARSERFLLGHRTERQVAARLSPLAVDGYSFLHDRAWPGSRSGAQIDHVVVGPGGVFILDTKAWADVQIAAGRLHHGQADVTDDLSGLADLGYGTEAVLADLGLAPGEVHVALVFAGRRMPPTTIGTITAVGELDAAAWINAHGRRLTDLQLDAVHRAVMDHFPVARSAPTLIDRLLPPVALAEAEPAALLTVDEVSDIFLAGMLAEPIERWMSFLHPEQSRLVRRSFNGPARIRGAAGTGKTVVGLHRAAYLARAQPKRVLVTSYVKTLPVVLGALLARLAPEAVDRVDLVGVDAFARRLLTARGVAVKVDSFRAGAAFRAAWNRRDRTGLLEALNLDESYWRAEISSVIKGRGLTTFEEYADLPRTGRKRPLSNDQRREVWSLFLAYQHELRARGIQDFDDVILLAEASLRSHPLDTYGAVVIDEAQDLSCAKMRLLHLLVGDAPDGLTIVGDGQQSIYPGGFTLAEAGIAIVGRGVVLGTNYRNTREIVTFAARDDRRRQVRRHRGLGRYQRCRRRRGAVGTRSPRSAASRRKRAHDAALVERLRAASCARADIAVLTLSGAKSRRRRVDRRRHRGRRPGEL